MHDMVDEQGRTFIKIINDLPVHLSKKSITFGKAIQTPSGQYIFECSKVRCGMHSHTGHFCRYKYGRRTSILGSEYLYNPLERKRYGKRYKLWNKR